MTILLTIKIFISNILLIRDRFTRYNFDNNDNYLSFINKLLYLIHYISFSIYIIVGYFNKDRVINFILFLFAGIITVIPIVKLKKQKEFLGKLPGWISTLSVLR
jgi:hypothetical protein